MSYTTQSYHIVKGVNSLFPYAPRVWKKRWPNPWWNEVRSARIQTTNRCCVVCGACPNF